MNKPVVAAFDFDGTITFNDSLLYFLRFTTGKWTAAFKLLLELPAFTAFTLGLLNRQQVKERILSRFYKGLPIALLKEQGQRFAQEALKRHLRPEAVKKIIWHLSEHHRCILISASLDVYLQPLAQLMGFHDTISSQLEVDNAGLITGKLKGANCRGGEKVRRLKEIIGDPSQYLVYVYGDSAGDKELLAIADYPHYKTMNTVKGR